MNFAHKNKKILLNAEIYFLLFPFLYIDVGPTLFPPPAGSPLSFETGCKTWWISRTMYPWFLYKFVFLLQTEPGMDGAVPRTADLG